MNTNITKHFKILLVVLTLVFQTITTKAQSYTSANYATTGDTIYLTQAVNYTGLNFDTTGVNMNWDFSTIKAYTQDRTIFRKPTQTGFTMLQWAYIYNSNNVNLSSTNGSIKALGSLQTSNQNEYFKNTSTSLAKKAASYDISINSKNISIKSVYTSADVVYKFPLNYGNKDSSSGGFINNIPGIYYRNNTIKRVNTVDGSGILKTPFGTFSNVLRLVTSVVETDSIDVNGISTPTITTKYRELQWFSATAKYPLLIVHQTLTGKIYVTSSVTYFDKIQYYQPNASFAYYPLSPSIGDTVLFQNLSTNTNSFKWDFGDATSGADNNSTAINPTHIFLTADTFLARLIAFNGKLSDTSYTPVVVNSGTMPKASFTASSDNVYIGNEISFINSSTNSSFFTWQFESGIPSVSFSQNPMPVKYNKSGTFKVKLTVSNSNGVDSLIKYIKVNENQFYTISGKVIYINQNNTPLNNVYLILKTEGGLIITTTSTDSSGKYSLNNLGKGIYTIEASTKTPWGGVDPGDALAINRFYIGIYTFNDKLTELASDVNNDYSINPGDALMINRRYIGVINTFNINDWQFDKISVTIDNSDVLQNIKTICAGDTNVSYEP